MKNSLLKFFTVTCVFLVFLIVSFILFDTMITSDILLVQAVSTGFFILTSLASIASLFFSLIYGLDVIDKPVVIDKWKD